MMNKNFFNKIVMIQVGKYTRPVSIKYLSRENVSGYVGKAYFSWDYGKYALPFVKIKGIQNVDDGTRKLVADFIIAYFKILKEGKRKSPLHFEESNKQSPSKPRESGENYVSGVPLWMREEHKLWRVCHCKNGSSYLRRTRFKPESREIVEFYLPYCSQCIYRTQCEKACTKPEAISKEKFVPADKEVRA